MNGWTLTRRLPVRVPPIQGESLRGYLMRSAAENDLSGPDRILMDTIGSARLPITPGRASVIADYCRCDVPEFFQLFGIEQRSVEKQRQWQLAGEWITKDYFVRSNQPSVCPECLLETCHLRGSWELTFNVACPRHGCMLIDRCPGCRKRLSPHRRRMATCNCGYRLDTAPVQVGTAEAVFIAALIEMRIAGTGHLPREVFTPVGHDIAERLTVMNLDILFKSLWFFGHIADSSPFEAWHGRKKPDSGQSLQIIRGSLALLAGWPDSFLRALETIRGRNSQKSGTHPEASLMPVRRYMENELVPDRLGFVHLAYERFIRSLWKESSAASRRYPRHPQLELF